jgi:hypothetical protein
MHMAGGDAQGGGEGDARAACAIIPPGYAPAPSPSPEVEFLEEIQTEVLRVFLLAIHRHLY